MDRYQETFQTWNKVALLYQEKFMHLDLYNASYDFFCAMFTQNNTRILEIGCGPGNITHYLLQKRPDFDILGIDVAPKMIELAQANNPTARFEVFDCRQLDCLKMKFDAIVSGFCLPYLSQQDCQKLIADSLLLLNQNGIIYLSFVADDPQKSNYQTGSSGDRTFFYYHTLQDVLDLLASHRFAIVQLFTVSYLKTGRETEEHTIVIAKLHEVV